MVMPIYIANSLVILLHRAICKKIRRKSMIDYIKDNFMGKNIEIYCGHVGDVYYGVVKDVSGSFIKLEKDDKPIFVVMDKIQAICIAE